MVCYYCAMIRSIVLGLTLMLSALPALAQSVAFNQGMATSPTTVASPLDGNWQITGNRELKQSPLISMAIHVNGKQVTAQGDRLVSCPTSPNAGGGGNFSMSGEIDADGSFTLRTHRTPWRDTGSMPPNILRALQHPTQLTITGKVPDVGSTSWGGTYTITGEQMLPVCSLDQGGAFTASRLAPLDGTFSGPVIRGYPRTTLKFNLTAKQGEFVTWVKKVGPAYTYLPLTGTITVEGSPCFKHGTADASTYNTMQGDLATLRFKMGDESELFVTGFYTNPEATELAVRTSVKGGRCDNQNFNGTLSRQ